MNRYRCFISIVINCFLSLLDNIKPNSQAKKTACTVHKHVQIYNSAFPRANSGLGHLSHAFIIQLSKYYKIIDFHDNCQSQLWFWCLIYLIVALNILCSITLGIAIYYFGILAANGGNVEERLKAARERREEQQKLLGTWISCSHIIQTTVLMQPCQHLANDIFPQPPGRRTGWSGSSGPASTMNSNCRSARRNFRIRGLKKRRSVLLWKRSASRSWRRRR